MAECGGCGGSPFAMPEVANLPLGEAQPNDVLAQALWLGNRSERGRITGRLYPRASNGKQVWVAPQDIDAAPDKWSRVIAMPKTTLTTRAKAPDDFAQFANFAMQALGAQVKPPPDVAPTAYGVPGIVKPNVAQVLRLYGQQQ